MMDLCSHCRLIRFAALLPLILSILTVGGCSSKKKVNLSGKVIYKGQPVRPGYVQIFDSQGTILSAADLNEDGTFTATDIPPGEVQVIVRPLSKSVPISRKYQDLKTSDLRYTITPSTNHLEIELQ